MMTYSRHQEMLRSVPANARKLYEIIPISEGWDFSRIHQEAHRRGMNFRVEVIMGCVAELKDAGLVQTDATHQHRRTPHKPKPEIVLRKDKEPTVTVDKISTRPPNGAAPAAPPAKTALEHLSGIADRIKKLADVATMMATEANAISDDLAEVALTIEERTEASQDEVAKLRNLAQALKALQV